MNFRKNKQVFQEFSRRIIRDTENDEFAQTIVRSVKRSMTALFTPFPFLWRNKQHSKRLLAAMMGDSRGLLQRGCPPSSIMYAIIITGVMRHDELFLKLSESLPGFIFADSIFGLIDPRACQPHTKFAYGSRFMSTNKMIIVHDVYDEELDRYSERPTESLVRIAVKWRCWAAVRMFLSISRASRVCTADFIVSRAARVIQRRWRDRRRRCAKKLFHSVTQQNNVSFCRIVLSTLARKNLPSNVVGMIACETLVFPGLEGLDAIECIRQRTCMKTSEVDRIVLKALECVREVRTTRRKKFCWFS